MKFDDYGYYNLDDNGGLRWQMFIILSLQS